MASKRPQTIAKRTRELALKEKRERKRLKKEQRVEAAHAAVAAEQQEEPAATDPDA
jgi:hypothetical protein